jgi:ATP-dependent DNA helicase PIF1
LTDGVILPNHANILLNHTSETKDAIKLFAKRWDVDRVNNENIANLPSKAVTYKCFDNFERKEHHREDSSLDKYSRLMDDGSGALQQLVWSFLPICSFC